MQDNLMVTIFTGISLFFYTICFIPQIAKNYVLKSGRGVSELFLFLFLNMLTALSFYAFIRDLPITYKFFIPLQAVFVCVLMLQRLWYENDHTNARLSFYFIINLLIWFALVPVSLLQQEFVASLTGWLAVIAGAFSQVPQVIKIFRERSVKGFDIRFVFFVLLASIIEFTTALFGGLPLQIKLMSFRAAVFSMIMLLQFKLFSTPHNNA